MMLRMGDEQNDDAVGTSLWTTPAASTGVPLKEASIDPTVSAETVREAVRAGRDRANTFSGRVTEELLRKSF
jgi:hypothetical protein